MNIILSVFPSMKLVVRNSYNLNTEQIVNLLSKIINNGTYIKGEKSSLIPESIVIEETKSGLLIAYILQGGNSPINERIIELHKDKVIHILQ